MALAWVSGRITQKRERGHSWPSLEQRPFPEIDDFITKTFPKAARMATLALRDLFALDEGGPRALLRELQFAGCAIATTTLLASLGLPEPHASTWETLETCWEDELARPELSAFEILYDRLDEYCPLIAAAVDGDPHSTAQLSCALATRLCRAGSPPHAVEQLSRALRSILRFTNYSARALSAPMARRPRGAPRLIPPEQLWRVVVSVWLVALLLLILFPPWAFSPEPREQLLVGHHFLFSQPGHNRTAQAYHHVALTQLALEVIVLTVAAGIAGALLLRWPIHSGPAPGGGVTPHPSATAGAAAKGDSAMTTQQDPR